MSKASSKGLKGKPFTGGGIFVCGGYETSSETERCPFWGCPFWGFIHRSFFFFGHGFLQVAATAKFPSVMVGTEVQLWPC